MPRRYGADGTRLWNGKTPEEFTEADAYRFMAETEAILQRKELMDDPAQPAPASGKEDFYLSKRQLVCFGSAGAVGIPAYLLTRGTLGNTGAMFLMLGIMLPAFLLAMYEKDGLPFEKVVRNIIRAKFLRPGIRAYRTENIYAPFAGPGAGKEDVIEKHKEEKRSRRQG